MHRYLFWLAPVLLAACADRSTIQAIDIPVISTVQNDLSHQVGLYMAASHQEPVIMINKVPTPLHLVPASDTDPTPPKNTDDLFACGRGDVAFDITSIKAELTATNTDTYGGSVDATVPVSSIVSLNASYNGSKAIENSQTLDYNLWPLAYEEQKNISNPLPPFNLQEAPIAYTLLSLRSALIASAMKYDYSGKTIVKREWKPCFRDFNKDKISDGSGNTYVLGLKVTKDDKFGFKVSLAGIVNIGASGERLSSSGNTLTVSFGQTGLKQLADATTTKENVCKKDPKGKACKAAIIALVNLGQMGTLSLVRPDLFRDLTGPPSR